MATIMTDEVSTHLVKKKKAFEFSLVDGGS